MTDSIKPRTILVTFAGRRDRMELLTRYVDAAMAMGAVDEWHVWDFSRCAEDARWLRETFPAAQVTPNNSDEYFRLPETLEVAGGGAALSFEVVASNDVHIGLARAGQGPAYEIVLGGWGNQASAIRRFDDPAQLCAIGARDPDAPPLVLWPTPDLLPEFGASKVELRLGAEGVDVLLDGAPILRHDGPVADGEYEVFYRTGYGCNGDWRFAAFAAHRRRLFIGGRSALYAQNAMFYTTAYQYYAANRAAYENDVFLKCDDDIVYVDLARLRDFIAFRKANPQYFLVSANVVNNGVCGHFQQRLGAVPPGLMRLEAPPGGLCGSLWASGAKAEALHRYFLRYPMAFDFDAPEAIVWSERISINFIAFLGRDLVHIPDIMADDEHDLCYGVRKRVRKQNCIYAPFVVAHLSFWRQEAEMDVDGVLAGYRALWDSQNARLAAPARPRLAAA